MKNNIGGLKIDTGMLENGEPYTWLAEIYDRVMDHVDYLAWSKYISSLLSRYSKDSSSILEIACGTGSMALELTFMGYDVVGTDISPSMLKKAKYKFIREELSPRFFASNMTHLPSTGPFDAVICLYDSLNYLTDREDVLRTLSGVCGLLKPGGVFILDVCTVKNSELFFRDHSMVENYGEISYERFCRYDRERKIQENHFKITRRGKTYSESHFQRIYLLSEIRDIIEQTALEELACYDDMTFMIGSEDSERVHFVLRKK